MNIYPRRFALATLLFAASAGLNAASLNWDPTATGGATGGGTGSWDTTTPAWWNGTADTVWVNASNDTAVFGGAGDSVTLATDITANALTFNADGYALSGATLTLAGATPTITVTNSGDTATIADQLMGTAGLVKTGAGTLVLSGDNRFTGNIAINAGVLELAPGGKLYNAGYNNSAVVTVNTGGTWRVNDFSYNGVGQLADYAARRVINGGTIEVVGATHSAGQDFTVTTSGGTFRYAPASNTSVLTLNGNANDNIRLNGTVTFDTAAGIVVTEVMQGAGGVIKTGTGTLTLGAANTFTGGTTVTGGTLVLANAAALQNSVLTPAGSAIVFDQSVIGKAFTLGGLTGSGALALVNNAASPAAIALTVGNGNVSSSYSGVLSGAGSLNKTGTGTLTLSGANNFSGGTELTGGVLSINAVGALGTGYLAIKNGAVLRYTGTGSEKLATGTLWFNNASAGIEVADSGAVLTLWRTSGNFNQQLTKTGAGTLRFGANGDNSGSSAVVNAGVLESISSANNNLASVTVNTGATFRLGAIDGAGNALTADHQIWNGGTATINAGGAFDMNGMSETVGTTTLSGAGIAGSGALFNNAATASTLGGNATLAAATSLGGSGSLTLTGVVGGANSLTKTGAGTLTLSGNNTYSGATTVSAGRLNLGGTNTSAITVDSGATLGGAGSTTGALTLADGSTLAVGSTAFTANGVTLAGTTQVTFDSALTGGTVYDVLNYGTGGVTGGLGNLAAAARGTLAQDIVNNKFTFTAGATATRTWNTTSGVWDNFTTTNFAEGDRKFSAGDTVVFNNPGAASTVTLAGSLIPTSVSVTNTDAYTFAGTGSIAGASTTLTKAGTGTLILATNNTYGGATTISAGTLRIGDGGTTGSIGAGAVTNNGVLAFNRSDATTFANAITGSGSVRIESGTVTFNTSKAYTGGTTIAGGTLQIGGAVLGSGTVTIDAAGTLATTAGFNLTNAVTLNGAINATGAGETRFSGVLTGGGTLNVNTTGGGKVDIFGTAGANLSGGTVNIADGSTVYTSGATIAATVNVTGTGNTESRGALRITAGTTYSGPVNLTGNTTFGYEGAGNLISGNISAGTAGLKTLTLGASANSGAGAALAVSGNLTDGAGQLALTKALGGAVTLSGTNTYTGATTINAGTLAVSGTLRINGAAGITLASGATLTLSGTLIATDGADTIANNGGTFTAGGTLNLNGAFDGFNAGASGAYTLITGTGGTNSGAFTAVNGYNTSVWSDVTYSGGVLTFTAVPEPSTYGLLGAGALAAMAFVKRRRKKA